jgi:hypothetical protein
MKRSMLLAFGLFIALTQLFAQEKLAQQEKYEHYSDTLLIRLQDGNRILITGMYFADMIQYNRADSLKELFLNDFTKAAADQSVSSNAAVVYYFVHDSGKRRIKAETVEYVDNTIDVGYEITRLDLDLPKYQYHIYDLKKKCTISFYLTSPDMLRSVLSSFNINEAIAELARNKEEYRKYYRIELSKTENTYNITRKAKKGSDILWLNPTVGAGLFGNTPVPTAHFELMVAFNNKYNIGVIKTGISAMGFPLVDMAGGEVKKINYVRAYELKLLMNLNEHTHRKEFWFGAQAGLVKSTVGSFNDTFKWGFTLEPSGGFAYSFDFYLDKNKNMTPLVGVKLPF